MNVDNRGIFISLPLPEEQVFRSKSIREILTLLSNNLHQEFSISEIGEITGYKGGSLNTGLKVLKILELVETSKKGRKTMIRLNQEKLVIPEDLVMSIPQKKFRKPINIIKKEIVDSVDYVAGITVFGSVARGEADRKSDIDILVVVEKDLTEARQRITNIVSELKEKSIEGDRYDFEVLVESSENIRKRGEEMINIFTEGVDILKTTGIEEIRKDVLHGK